MDTLNAQYDSGKRFMHSEMKKDIAKLSEKELEELLFSNPTYFMN